MNMLMICIIFEGEDFFYSIEKKSSFDVYYETIAKEGYRGLFRGFQITVIRDSSFSLLQFPIWEQLKTSYAIYIMNNFDATCLLVLACSSRKICSKIGKNPNLD